jgi:hypothetical protein
MVAQPDAARRSLRRQRAKADAPQKASGIGPPPLALRELDHRPSGDGRRAAARSQLVAEGWAVLRAAA